MKTWACLLILVAISVGCAKPESSPAPTSDAMSEPDLPMDPCDVVYLGKSPDFYITLPGLQDHGLLSRELFRQALLISARDELGLVTRDAWLGDAIPSQESIRPFDLAMRVGPIQRLEVLRVLPSSARAIGSVDLPVPPPDHYQKRLWIEAEKLSRTNFVEILKKSLGPRQPRPWRPDLALPGTVEESLREMTFLAQFKAAREIHDLIAAEGASPALLGALVRAYANLGILTEFHFDPAHKVFKARAILYAQRWLSRQPDSLPAQWHRAYALALAGNHAEALDDLESAEKAWQATAEKQRPPRPGWVALVDACCRYNVDKLAAERDHAELGQLAALLHYHTVELAGNPRWALETAGAALAKIPGCLRVYDGVCGFSGVAAGHLATLAPIQVLGRTVYGQVQQMPGLPESVGAKAKLSATEQAAFGESLSSMGPEFKARSRLIAALREASRLEASAGPEGQSGPKGEPGNPRADGPGAKSTSRPPDSGEPSWAALAHLIHDVSFVHIWRRARFERDVLSVPTEDFLALAAPLVADHPLRPFVDTLAWDVVKQREAIQQAARFQPDGLELHALPIYASFSSSPTESGKTVPMAIQAHRDNLTRDYVVGVRLLQKQDNLKQLESCARSLLCFSPHSPLARAILINAGAASKAEIAEWEKLAVRYPALASALAYHYAKAQQWDDAARYCQEALKIVEDKAIYEFLADVYMRKGDEDRWLQTLEAALRLPDYGLEHAAIQKNIAWHFMGKRQWKRALPYATASAESYSNWGLLCAAACHEGLQEWDKAEEYVQAAAHRYRGSSVAWYYFCRRTGHGDLEAARNLAKAYVEDPSAQEDLDARYVAAGFYILERQPHKALAIYGQSFARHADPFFGLWVVLLADEVKDAKARDAALARIRTGGPSVVRKDLGRVRKELIQVAAWIEGDLARGGKGEIDLTAVDKFRAASGNPGEVAYFDLFLARYLQSRGKRDAAIRYWKERIACTDVLHFVRTVAGAALCDLGMMPESYKALLESGPKADAKAVPEGNKQSEKKRNKEGKPAVERPPGTAAKSRACRRQPADALPSRVLPVLGNIKESADGLGESEAA